MDKYNAHPDSEINEFSYGYARQAAQPAWFDRLNPLHFSNTSGSSPFNEWAGFHSEAQALEWVNQHAGNSQGFIDTYESVDGAYYDVDDLDYTEDEATCETLVTPKPGAEPAGVADLVCKLLEH